MQGHLQGKGFERDQGEVAEKEIEIMSGTERNAERERETEIWKGIEMYEKEIGKVARIATQTETDTWTMTALQAVTETVQETGRRAQIPGG